MPEFVCLRSIWTSASPTRLLAVFLLGTLVAIYFTYSYYETVVNVFGVSFSANSMSENTNFQVESTEINVTSLVLTTVTTPITSVTGAKSSSVTPTNSTTNSTTTIDLDKQLEEALVRATTKYNILLWYIPFGKKWPEDNIVIPKCGNCELTYDRNKVDDPATKAVVFHFAETNLLTMPKPRRADQYYVWFDLEGTRAVHMRGITLENYEGFFNLTLTYRRDSDVYYPYDRWDNILYDLHHSGSGDAVQDIDELLRKKDKFAIWIVSNCGGTKGAKTRMDLVSKLVELGLNVDRRGSCFPSNPPVRDVSVTREYKFYLAFENNYHCADYLTEKVFHNSLRHDVVPIIWGARKSDYEAVMPPHSGIYVDDFEDLSKLIEYLNYLDKNDTAYREYFLWRTLRLEDVPNYKRATSFCQLCRILHGINIDNIYNPSYEQEYSQIPLFTDPGQQRMVQSLREWFYGLENRECLPMY